VTFDESINIETMTEKTRRNYFFFGLLGLITILFLYLLKPFFYPIFWAAVIASLFRPLFTRLNKKISHPNLSTIIVILIILVIIILPSFLIGSILFTEAMTLYTSFEEGKTPIKDYIKKIPDVIRQNQYAQRLHINETFLVDKLSGIVRGVADYIFTGLKGLTQNTLLFFAMFLVMLYTLFFFIRDGEKILKKAYGLFPLGEKLEKMLYEKFTSAAQATLKGNLIIAFIQGSLGGLVFYFVGIQGALIWWILMVFLAVIPGVGCSFIWLPAAIAMLATNHIWEGITILLAGTLVISTIDNILRPVLVGRDIQLHPLLIFFSTLGGIVLFGFSGFVIGPIIAALFFSFWEMYEQHQS
jgi:predicted PurR-regulated permease PerM